MLGQVEPTPYDLNFRLLGIPVRVHPVFWLTGAILAWNPGMNLAEELDLVLVRIVCIFVAVLVHEMGHALVTRAFGWPPEIVLYFFGGYATSMRHSPWKNIAVSFAGPATGLGLFGAVLAFALVVRPDHRLLYDAVRFSLFINLAWNLVNLMPVSPLDGGQITREFLRWISPRNGVEVSLLISTLIAAGVAVWCFYSRSQGQGVFGLEPTFLGFLFGYLAFQSWQQYEAARRGYW